MLLLPEVQSDRSSVFFCELYAYPGADWGKGLKPSCPKFSLFLWTSCISRGGLGKGLKPSFGQFTTKISTGAFRAGVFGLYIKENFEVWKFKVWKCVFFEASNWTHFMTRGRYLGLKPYYPVSTAICCKLFGCKISRYLAWDFAQTLIGSCLGFPTCGGTMKFWPQKLNRLAQWTTEQKPQSRTSFLSYCSQNCENRVIQFMNEQIIRIFFHALGKIISRLLAKRAPYHYSIQSTYAQLPSEETSFEFCVLCFA